MISPSAVDRPLSFDTQGLPHPGEYLMTLDGLRSSTLVAETPGRNPEDTLWRRWLFGNLETLVGQLWAVGIENIYVGGSFFSNKPRPADLDGYFDCDRTAYKTRALHRALNAIDPFQAWTWRAAGRRPVPDGRPKIPLWHHYRIELLPYYGQTASGTFDRFGCEIDFPTMYRSIRITDDPRGIIRIIKSKFLQKTSF